ncbi:hypothetical protein ACJJTC_015979 [Scirpophaga incertulas]
MGQSPSSVRSKGSRKSLRTFSRKNKLNKSNLSHTFNLPPSEEYPELMNVNTATEEQLMTLPGVSRQLAQEIVRHRQMIGRFKRVDDLALVSGIGADKLELLRPEICTRKQLSRTSSCTQSLDSMRLNTESKLCSVNASSVFQLQCVPGLNQELAANIVDYRNKKGPFKSLDDLIKVRGMDILRVSTVKQHLSLEMRKSESAQHLNGYANGWKDRSITESLSNGFASTPKTPHRKSLSMPSKLLVTLPNGFAAAPVNDILDLLSAYSHRPVVEEVFGYERDGVRCCRLSSWNLHQLSVDKVTNPGVMEVICRTILENKLSIIAIQDVLEEAALKLVCEELNSPTLRRVREWRSNSYRWEYCISDQMDNQYLGFLYDAGNKAMPVEDVDLEQVALVTKAGGVGRLQAELTALRGERYCAVARAFLICNRPVILLNVRCHSTLSDVEHGQLHRVAKAATSSGLQLVVLGEFSVWENVDALPSCHPLLDEEVSTTIDKNYKGLTSIIYADVEGKSRFNGKVGTIRSGLSHLAIPRGWSWGGPASPFCPVWAEYNIPD